VHAPLAPRTLLRAETLRGGVAALALALGGALLAALLAHASASSGPGIVVAPAALAIAAVCLLWPLPLLTFIFVLVVLVEGTDLFVPQLSAPLYTSVFKGLTPVDFLILLLFFGTLLDAYRREGRFLGVGPLNWPLALLGAATLAGAATGHGRGASVKAIYEPVVVLSHVILLPFVVVNLTRGRVKLERALGLLAALAVAKSLLGLLIVVGGRQEAIHGAAVSYLEPTANWLVMLYLLAMLACALKRVRLPLWMWGATPLALADFVLSYRRSFWLGAVLGIVVVVLLGSGRRGRRVVVPTVIMLALAAAIFLPHLGNGEVRSSPVLQRVVSLNPTSLSANAEDRYRIDERRNVLANLRNEPITGLGIAIPWAATKPLSLEHPGGREYTHMVLLWYWMKLGLLGLLAYASVIGATLWMALRVWMKHGVAAVRACALAMLGAVLGLMVAELTASFTGVDYRFSIVFPVILGLLAVAFNQTRPPEELIKRSAYP
jgi:hypothetical protein